VPWRILATLECVFWCPEDFLRMHLTYVSQGLTFTFFNLISPS
jgi:hypothetical protein